MAGNLNRPNAGFVPPYPVTPPGTQGTNSYFPPQPTNNITSSTSATSPPPPRPPKLPNNPNATGQQPPPLPARNGSTPPAQQPGQSSRPSSSQQKPLPDPSRQNRPNTSDGRPINHGPSASVPSISQLQAAAEDKRRKSEDQVRRRPSHPYGLGQQGQQGQQPLQSQPQLPNLQQQQQLQQTSGPPRRDDMPPPPPPKPFQSATDLPAQMSQATLTSGNQNGDAKPDRRRGSKGRNGRPHLSEMDRARRQKNATRSRLRILSLDGGGIRGYSTLLLLETLMHDIFVEIHGRAPRRDEPLIKPCEVFDLIGGTGTGGLIALMLGRLRMDVQTCKDVYTRMTRYVFETDKRFIGVPYGETLYKASKLERAIRTVVFERTKEDHLDLNTEINSEDEDWDLEPKGGHYDDEKDLERKMSMIGRTDSIREIAAASRIASNEGGSVGARRWGNSEALLHDKRKGRCKTLVTAVYQGSSDSSNPAIFRSYSSGVESMTYPDCRIHQAGRATCAVLAAFKPIKINQDVFLDEGTGRYNPTPTVLEEACVNEWPGREIGLVVSLGTGKRPKGGQQGDNKVQWWENLGTSLDTFTQARRRLMTKIDYCETTHLNVVNEELAKYGISKNRYFRFNVDTGVGEVAMNEWMRLSEVSTSTRVYCAGPEVSASMKECSRRMAKLTRDKWRKKMVADGGVIPDDAKKGVLVSPDGTTLKMSATVTAPVPTVYYEMMGDIPEVEKKGVEIDSSTPGNGNPNKGAVELEERNQQLESMFGGNQPKNQPPKKNTAGPPPVEMPGPPRVPAIRITPPSVKRPGGRATDVELPA